MSTEEWPAYGPSNLIPFRDNDGLREAAIPNADLWNRRSELLSLYENSRRTLTAPWAMLGMAMLRALHSIPYSVRYQSFRGTASLNAALVLVGDTGGGKSILARQCDLAVPFINDFGGIRDFPLIEPGSGESLPDRYANVALKDDPEQNIMRGDLLWRNQARAEMFGFDELGRLVQMGQRGGSGAASTIFEYLKQGWSGSGLGRVLSSGNGVMLPPDSYRMTFIVNAQPDRCAPLFTDDEIAGGFPGRMLWLETRDPAAPKELDRTEVIPREVRRIDWRNIHVIRALPEMDEAHEQDQIRFHLGQRGPLDGHEVMVRAKVAIALMRLNGRTELNSDDWELAGMVMAESTRVRNEIQQRLANNATQEQQRRGAADAARAVAAEQAANTLTLTRIVARLQAFEKEGVPEAAWYKKLAYRDREHYEDAVRSMRGEL